MSKLSFLPDWLGNTFDLLQSGLGCIDSWGALPEKQFRVPYGDYTFRFMLKPTVK